MRLGRILLIAMGILLVPRISPAMKLAMQMAEFDGPMEWGGRRGSSPEQTQAMLRQQIQQALATPRQSGQDDWAWRDAVEDRLAAMGAAALRPMRAEMDVRSAYEYDVLVTAIFRIQNSPLNPKDAIRTWAAKSLQPPATMPAPVESFPSDLKIKRIMNRNLPNDFPNHLFYVIESKTLGLRLVLALAADSKVQPLPDDAALAKFMHIEFEPTHTELGMSHASTAAAILALSRTVDVSDAEAREEPFKKGSQTSLKLDTRHAVAKVLFDDAGLIKSIVTTSMQTPEIRATPITPPDPKRPPPPMPD